MKKAVLLTSFTTWESHQKTNSSDELLIALLKTNPPRSLHFLRQLPVDFELAPQKAIAHVDRLRPDVVLCCGMAERRSKLSLESRAVVGDKITHTAIDLDWLTAGLTTTEISYDAGQFVCNTLYYDMLNHLQKNHPASLCVFVHVPILTPDNLGFVLADFQVIVERLAT